MKNKGILLVIWVLMTYFGLCYFMGCEWVGGGGGFEFNSIGTGTISRYLGDA